MIYLIMFLWLFALSVIEVIHKKNRKEFFYIGVFNTIWISIVIGFNRWSYDYQTYNELYKNYQILKDLGFKSISRGLNFLELEYSWLLFFVGILFLLVIKNVLKNIWTPNLFLILYVIYPLVIDINQTRNLIMMLFLVVSIENISKKRFFVYQIISTSFHSIGLVYFPLFFLNKISRKNFYKLILLGFLGLFISINLIYEIAYRYNIYKILMYYNPKSLLSPSVVYHLSMIILDVVLVRYMDKRIKLFLSEKVEQESFEIYYRVFFYPILFFSLFLYFQEFSRIYRNLFIIKYIYVAKALKYFRVKQRITISLCMFIYSLVNLIIFNYSTKLIFFKHFNENQIIYYLKETIQAIYNL